MTIVFFSNTLNHHQIDLCDSLFGICGNDFHFIELSGLEESRKKMGFIDYSRDYKICAKDNKELTRNLAIESDVAIMGADSYEYLKLRLCANKGLTFSYSERWLKKGLINIISPIFLRQIFLYLKYKKSRSWYMLCASGFLSCDLNKLHLFKKRCYKWGYFPDYSKPIYLNPSKANPIKLIWVGRFIDWKHPLLMFFLGMKLANAGYDFKITMIGDGPEKKKLESSLEDFPSLKSKFNLLGNQSNASVIEEMANSHIFCFTSDQQEGWGAVLGEAMAAGCCPVASSAAGATPFLIKNDMNGLVFNSEDINDLFNKVKYLIDNPKFRIHFAEEARKTMCTHWSAPIAANNFVKLCKAKLSGNKIPNFIDEPCELIKS